MDLRISAISCWTSAEAAEPLVVALASRQPLGVGASKVAQLESNIAATEIRLSDDQMKRLDEASAPAPGFSAGLAAPAIRRMVFGGRNVAGWSEQRR